MSCKTTWKKHMDDDWPFSPKSALPEKAGVLKHLQKSAADVSPVSTSTLLCAEEEAQSRGLQHGWTDQWGGLALCSEKSILDHIHPLHHQHAEEWAQGQTAFTVLLLRWAEALLFPWLYICATPLSWQRRYTMIQATACHSQRVY